MSKERARRRAARQAASARAVADAQARVQTQQRARRRRERRRAAVRGLLPRRRRWSRRTRAQRASVALGLAAVAVLTVLLVDPWSVRIAVALVALLATPAIVTMILDRSTR